MAFGYENHNSMRTLRKLKPTLDLAPLADVAFLMLLYFALTTRLGAHHQHEVDMPSSTYPITCRMGIPFLQIVIDEEGHTWIRIPQYLKLSIIQNWGQLEGHALSPATAIQFWRMEDIGFAPRSQGFARVWDPKAMEAGIADTEVLAEWYTICKKADPDIRISIIGDQNVSYAVIQKIFSCLQRQGVNRFSLLARLEHEDLVR